MFKYVDKKNANELIKNKKKYDRRKLFGNNILNFDAANSHAELSVSSTMHKILLEARLSNN